RLSGHTCGGGGGGGGRKRDNRVLHFWRGTNESLRFIRTIFQTRRHSGLCPGSGRGNGSIDPMRRKEPLGRWLTEIWDHQFHCPECFDQWYTGYLPGSSHGEQHGLSCASRHAKCAI